MFKINKKIEYALIIIKNFNTHNTEAHTARQIADKYNMSFDLTSKTLSLMSGKGWFLSKKGSKGGYIMVEDFKQVNLLTLIEVILGRLSSVDCLSGHLNCQLINECNLISPMYRLNKEIRVFCKSINIYDLISTNNDTKLETTIREMSSGSYFK